MLAVPTDEVNLFINLTPLVPLSFKGEGEEIERGAFAPLKLPHGSRSLRAKPLRAGGWEKRDKLKTGRGWGRSPANLYGKHYFVSSRPKQRGLTPLLNTPFRIYSFKEDGG